VREKKDLNLFSSWGRNFIKKLNPCIGYYIIFYLDGTILGYEEISDMVHSRTYSGGSYNTWSRQGAG
jgi:hypothetical protein